MGCAFTAGDRLPGCGRTTSTFQELAQRVQGHIRARATVAAQYAGVRR
jgi:hypothetical protein